MAHEREVRQRYHRRNNRNNSRHFTNTNPTEGRSRSKFFSKKLILALLGLGLPVIVGLLYRYNTGDPINPYDFVPISEIIQEQVDQCETLLNLEVQLENALAADPFVDIVKTNIQPALDTVASVRTQTTQYETMQRIPGGPVTFIQGAHKRLDDIENNIIDYVRDQEEAILRRKSAEIKAMITDYDNYWKESLVSGIATVVPLENEGIRLAPANLSDPDILNYFGKITFQELLNKLSNLAQRYKELEAANAEIIRVTEILEPKPPGGDEQVTVVEDVDESYLDEVKEYKADIIDVIDSDIYENGKYYKLLLLYRRPIMQKISRFYERLLTYEIEKQLPYRRLVTHLETDIDNLRQRLESLGS